MSAKVIANLIVCVILQSQALASTDCWGEFDNSMLIISRNAKVCKSLIGRVASVLSKPGGGLWIGQGQYYFDTLSTRTASDSRDMSTAYIEYNAFVGALNNSVSGKVLEGKQELRWLYSSLQNFLIINQLLRHELSLLELGHDFGLLTKSAKSVEDSLSLIHFGVKQNGKSLASMALSLRLLIGLNLSDQLVIDAANDSIYVERTLKEFIREDRIIENYRNLLTLCSSILNYHNDRKLRSIAISDNDSLRVLFPAWVYSVFVPSSDVYGLAVTVKSKANLTFSIGVGLGSKSLFVYPGVGCFFDKFHLDAGPAFASIRENDNHKISVGGSIRLSRILYISRQSKLMVVPSLTYSPKFGGGVSFGIGF